MDNELKGYEITEKWMKAYDATFLTNGKDQWVFSGSDDSNDTPTIFIWNPRKNLINMHKQKMPLIAAIPAYFDEYGLEIYDKNHSTYDFSQCKKEERYQLIGCADQVLFISYTNDSQYKHDNEIVRLISVRFALPPEKKLYDKNKHQMLGIPPPPSEKIKNFTKTNFDGIL